MKNLRVAPKFDDLTSFFHSIVKRESHFLGGALASRTELQKISGCDVIAVYGHGDDQGIRSNEGAGQRVYGRDYVLVAGDGDWISANNPECVLLLAACNSASRFADETQHELSIVGFRGPWPVYLSAEASYVSTYKRLFRGLERTSKKLADKELTQNDAYAELLRQIKKELPPLGIAWKSSRVAKFKFCLDTMASELQVLV